MLTANYEYSCTNRDHFQLPIQMQLSEKVKIFYGFFHQYLEFTLHFQFVETKVSLEGQVFLKLLTTKDVST